MTIILDGGMGQELVALSSKELTPLWSTQILLEEPHLVEQVHNAYFRAGADVATTNTYTTHRDRLCRFDLEDQFERLLLSACDIANRARDKHGRGLVYGGLGPTGKSYRTDLVLSVDEGAEVYSEMAGVLAPHVDGFLIETIVSLRQAEGALIGAGRHNKPVWLAVSVDDGDGSALRSGEPVTDVIRLAQKNNAAAVLVNCSTPEAVSQAITVLSAELRAKQISNLELGAYANGFTRITESFKSINSMVDELERRTDLDPVMYLEFAKNWHNQGAKIIGGCCEVGPLHIEMLAQHFNT